MAKYVKNRLQTNAVCKNAGALTQKRIYRLYTFLRDNALLIPRENLGVRYYKTE